MLINHIRMQSKEDNNKWPNQDEASSKFSKNQHNVLRYAVPLTPTVITLKYIVFIWNYNHTETMLPNRAWSPTVHFSAWMLFIGWILLFALEQHPFESHLLVVEHCFLPKITPQGIQMECFTKYRVTKRFLIRALVQARTSSDVTSKPVCILRWAGP